jgi:hypothetical protein
MVMEAKEIYVVQGSGLECPLMKERAIEKLMVFDKKGMESWIYSMRGISWRRRIRIIILYRRRRIRWKMHGWGG